MAEVPAGVVTLMSTVPAPVAGLVTVICVLESVMMVAAAVPKLTPVAPARPVPVMVTLAPPAVLPPLGETPVITGDEDGEPGDEEEEPGDVDDEPGDVDDEPGDVDDDPGDVDDEPGDVDDEPGDVDDEPGDGARLSTTAAGLLATSVLVEW